MTRSFDLVVIGAGTAGCVVAGRASEDPATRVLLVEAGPDPQPVPDIVANPKRQGQLILESDYVRMYEVERPDGSTFPVLSGRIMGGGSAVNNCAALRPLRVDFDAWARFGGDAWSYEALLPVMRAIEDDPEMRQPVPRRRRAAPPPSRPVPRRPPRPGPHRADRGGRRLRHAALRRPQHPGPVRDCASPYNVKDGIRQSTAVAYLDPARARPNLTVLADTTVVRLVLDGPRVTGVELVTPDGPETVLAGRVVLAAGVYHSPQLHCSRGSARPRSSGGTGSRSGTGSTAWAGTSRTTPWCT